MDPRIRLFLGLVEETKDASRPTLGTAIRLLGISEPRLLRLFKRDLGVSLKRYMKETRMVRAAKMVGDGALSIKAIALTAGYPDLSNFYRDFRKVHGTTPKEMRTKQLTSRFEAEQSLPVSDEHSL